MNGNIQTSNCHPERSAAESKDPVESLYISSRDSSTALGMTRAAVFGTWNFRDLDDRGWLNILEMRSVELRKVSRVYIADTRDDGIINSVRRTDPNHNERRAQRGIAGRRR